jgi:hypothetical protein
MTAADHSSTSPAAPGTAGSDFLGATREVISGVSISVPWPPAGASSHSETGEEESGESTTPRRKEGSPEDAKSLSSPSQSRSIEKEDSPPTTPRGKKSGERRKGNKTPRSRGETEPRQRRKTREVRSRSREPETPEPYNRGQSESQPRTEEGMRMKRSTSSKTRRTPHDEDLGVLLNSGSHKSALEHKRHTRGEGERRPESPFDAFRPHRPERSITPPAFPDSGQAALIHSAPTDHSPSMATPPDGGASAPASLVNSSPASSETVPDGRDISPQVKSRQFKMRSKSDFNFSTF